MLKTQTADVRNAAKSYIDKGWAVLPCLPKAKEPHFGLIKRSHLDATTDLDLVEFWLKMDKNMNIGINAIKSGLVIIDVDFRNGGKLNPEWTPTYTVKTADGYHLYYKDAGLTYRGSLGEGIDIKYKGYVVAAPSIHPSGATYTVENDLEVAELPTSILEALCRTW